MGKALQQHGLGRTREYNAACPIHGGSDDHDGNNSHNSDIYEEEDGDGDTTFMRRVLAFSRLKYFFSRRLS